MYAEVLIEYSAKAIDRQFTYYIPSHLRSTLEVGMKVLVPFGSMTVNGFVIKIKNDTDQDNLKEIIDVTDDSFKLNEELMELGKYIKGTTLCSLISAYQTMLPTSMKVKTISINYQKYDEYIELVNRELAEKFILDNKRATKQIDLLSRLLRGDFVFKAEYASTVRDRLINLGLIKINSHKKYRINVDNENEKMLVLNEEQANAVKEISSSFGVNNTFLIKGVTGSGKTEVYLNLIDQVLAKGKSAIMLVPEISLTTQMIDRFYKRFSNNVAIFHSALSDGEKFDEYHKILNGDVHVVVGTRSAIFVPLKDIGIIIMDEEQSSNYKQDNMPRYHARDVALKRCETHKCPLVLGSATPSLESMARGYKGVYKLLELNNRIGSSTLPDVTIVDMQEEARKRNMIISDLLDSKIKNTLSKNEQVILLLNRRGFTTIVSCKNCGHTFKCPYCDITLTYHKSSNNLRCHYCGYTLLNPDVCPECKEDALTSYGLGTEKLEEEISKRYNARVVRMDADTTSRKGSSKKIVEAIENREVDIIIGTQMLSKGFDFPYVTLVGIINADETLNIPDFRSGERTFELLTQTVGRAGRGKLKGEAVIQSFNSDNKILSYVCSNNYNDLYNYEMNIRKTLKYPPYFYLTSIKIASKGYELASSEARKVYSYLNRTVKDTIILGPTTASMFKVNNIYRFQIVLKYKNYNFVKDALVNLDDVYKTNTKVNIEIDNNPVRV